MKVLRTFIGGHGPTRLRRVVGSFGLAAFGAVEYGLHGGWWYVVLMTVGFGCGLVLADDYRRNRSPEERARGKST